MRSGAELHGDRRRAGEVLPVIALRCRVLPWLPREPPGRARLRVLLEGVAELQRLPLQPGRVRPRLPVHAATPRLPLRQQPIRGQALRMCHQPLPLARQPLLLHSLHGVAEHGPLSARQAPNAEPLPAEEADIPARDGAHLARRQRRSGSHGSVDGPGPAGEELDALQGLCQSEGRRRYAGVQPGADRDRLHSPAVDSVRLLLQNLAPASGEGS